MYPLHEVSYHETHGSNESIHVHNYMEQNHHPIQQHHYKQIQFQDLDMLYLIPQVNLVQLNHQNQLQQVYHLLLYEMHDAYDNLHA